MRKLNTINPVDDSLIEANDINIESKEERKERLAKEKAEKALLKQAKELNLSFVKFIKNIIKNKFSISSASSLPTLRNTDENLFREFTMTIHNDYSIEFNYYANDFTKIRFIINNEYLKNNKDNIVFYNNIVKANYQNKTFKIDAEILNKLRAAKTSEISAIRYLENSIEHDVFIDTECNTIKFNVDKPLDTFNTPEGTLLYDDIIDIDFDNDTLMVFDNKIMIPTSLIKIDNKNQSHINKVKVYNSGDVYIYMIDDDTIAEQYFKTFLE